MKKILFTLLICFATASMSYSQCTNSFSYGNGVLTSTIGSSDMIICHYAEEYGTWDGIIAGNSYATTSDIATDFLTVRSGSPTGPIVAFGTQPLNWIATVGGTHFIHINTDASCGQNTDCRDIETTNNGPAFACTNPAMGGTTQANVITACPGQTFTLSLNGASLGSGLDYQWQSSTDGITYVDIALATSSSYDASQTSLTYYQCIVTCSAGTQATSTPLMVDMGDCVIMGNGTATTCTGNFYDSGGGSGDYMDSELYTMTIYPSTPGSLLQVNFNTFELETCCDNLTIYNGNSTAAPLMGSFVTNPGSITSGAADGSLTFEFTSDLSVFYAGWSASIGCILPAPNDIVCDAIDITVDGTSTTYNNGGGSIQTGEQIIAPPTTGYNETDGWGESTLSFTTWFTFTAPASGKVKISCTDVDFDGQVAVYTVTDCNDFGTFTLEAANDDAMDFSSSAPEFTICTLTPGNQYYLMFDSGSTFTSGAYSIAISELDVSAGTFTNILDVCSGDTTDLFNGISGNDGGGTWTEMIPTVGLSGNLFNTAGLAYQIFDFEYVVVDGCDSDTSLAQVHIYGPSNAGNDGTLVVCKNEVVNLLEGLSGTVDLGGTWYDPSENPVSGNTITASFIPGQFNYVYITGNGVCADDTSNLLLDVQNCTAGIEEILFAEISVYPNPTNGLIYISNEGSTQTLSYEILDLNGRIISKENGAIAGTSKTEIDLNGKISGMYLLRIFNVEAEKVYRIVLE